MKCAYINRQAARGGLLFVAIVFLLPALVRQAEAQAETVLYSFNGASDGGLPAAGLVSDKDGNLYGTTWQFGDGSCVFPDVGCGTVFELMRERDGGNIQWTFKLLHTFIGGSDGADPADSLVLDQAGNLYGTTAWGGTGCGVVFRLSPTGAGTEDTWALTVLHTFHGADGANPYVGVTLAPPKLCGSPEHAIAGGNGKICIFGTATNGAYTFVEPGGVVFQISLGGRTLNYSVLYKFPGGCGGPGGPLALDKFGTLYGMAHLGGQYCSGSVFTLSRDSAAGLWTETDIYSFSGPDGWFPENQGLVMDQHENLYGTTSAGGTSSNCQAGCGAVFRLSKATGGGWYESGLYSLQGGADGWGPLAGTVVVNRTGVYGMTPSGGDPGCIGADNQPGCGVIYRISP